MLKIKYYNGTENIVRKRDLYSKEFRCYYVVHHKQTSRFININSIVIILALFEIILLSIITFN